MGTGYCGTSILTQALEHPRVPLLTVPPQRLRDILAWNRSKGLLCARAGASDAKPLPPRDAQGWCAGVQQKSRRETGPWRRRGINLRVSRITLDFGKISLSGTGSCGLLLRVCHHPI